MACSICARAPPNVVSMGTSLRSRLSSFGGGLLGMRRLHFLSLHPPFTAHCRNFVELFQGPGQPCFGFVRIMHQVFVVGFARPIGKFPRLILRRFDPLKRTQFAQRPLGRRDGIVDHTPDRSVSGVPRFVINTLSRQRFVRVVDRTRPAATGRQSRPTPAPARPAIAATALSGYLVVAGALAHERRRAHARTVAAPADSSWAASAPPSSDPSDAPTTIRSTTNNQS